MHICPRLRLLAGAAHVLLVCIPEIPLSPKFVPEMAHLFSQDNLQILPHRLRLIRVKDGHSYRLKAASRRNIGMCGGAVLSKYVP